MNFIEKINDSVFRFYRIAGRLIIKYSKHPRPSSSPFITGDGFRNAADFVYDTTKKTVTGPEVKTGDTVFVGDSLIEQFLDQVHPHITTEYILITHNGDATVNQTLFERAADKIIKWYGINVVYKHEKIIPLPIGIENKHYYVCGIPAIFCEVQRRNYQKKSKIFYAFSVSTNPVERQPALDAIKDHPEAETLSQWRGFRAYLHILATYKMVVSPPGSSVEGHSTWDTLYVGGVPIVKRSITNCYFESIGVPLLVVDNWEDLTNLTKDTIDKRYDDILQHSSPDTLRMEYWLEEINCQRP